MGDAAESGRAGAIPANAVPLCVDLDGTLIRTDMLHENVLGLAKASPFSLLSLFGWLGRGKAHLKHQVSERVAIDPAGLPYNEAVLDLIRAARAEGRPIVLATATPAAVAQRIADHLGLFDEVLASDHLVNLSARNKAEALVARYGAQGFDYAGNHAQDLPIFAVARHCHLVSSSGGLRRSAERHNPNVAHLDAQGGGLRSWIKALRLHQWLKNALIFVPLFAAKAEGDRALLLAACLSFLAFGLFASSVYVLNDLLDLQADRQHRTKRRRPFASGAIPVAQGIVAAPLLMAASVGLALAFLPRIFLEVLLVYGVITTAYSFALKRQVVVDVILLAVLYTIRILAGAAATHIRPSFWLLAFSMFIFLCLAMAKRYSELRQAVDKDGTLAGRGYMPSDLPVVLAMGSGSGLVSVLILAFYTQSEIVPAHYPAPEWLWMVPPVLLYWVVRLWMKANRGEVDDDPVIFAARDWQSLAVAGTMACLFVFASLGWRPW